MLRFKDYIKEKGPCWKGYRQIGTKKKNGKEVPNCVPEDHGPGEEEVLNELFNQSYSWSWTGKGRTWTAVFTTKDKQEVVVEFVNIGNNLTYIDFTRDDEFDITGQGDSFRIFATVLEIIENYVTQNKPKRMMFTASKGQKSGASRSNLYTRMIRKFAGKINYAFVINQKRNKTEFILKRNEKHDTIEEEVELNEGSESWEDGYKRRVVKTTDPEHEDDGYNWRIKGKDDDDITIKLYKEKPSYKEFTKQMKRVSGHKYGD